MMKFREIVLKVLCENGIQNLEEFINPSRFDQYIENNKHSFAIISAELETKSSKENKKNTELLKQIVSKKYHYEEVLGGYTSIEGIATKEHSLLIYGISKNEALELGNRFHQESITYKSKGYGPFYILYSDKRSPSTFGKVMIEFQKDSGKDKYNKIFKGDEQSVGYTQLHKSNKPDLKFEFKPKD